MNPVQIVEAARPEVGLMPAHDRRHLREHIFDVAMRSRSEHAPLEVASPNNRASNALRLAALGLLGTAAVGGLLYSASRDTPGTSVPSATTEVASADATASTLNTIAQAPVPTVASTTTTPPIAGSDVAPLLLPPERNRLDSLTVSRSLLGASALMLRAPDLSTISLYEVDGLAPSVPDAEVPADGADDDVVDDDATTTTTTTIATRQFSAVSVEQFAEDPLGVYRLDAPCGTVTVLDVEGRAEYRPEITQLFDAMQIVDGVIEITLPDDWGAISSGPSTDEFVFGLPVEIDGRNVTITLAQYPGGSIALAANDQFQYSPATFNGAQAWLHRDTENPEALDLVTMIGSTAIRISASNISVAEAESVISGLTAGDIDEWTNRFGTLPVDLDPDIRTCTDQPEFRLV